jgi:hypothetical protein
MTANRREQLDAMAAAANQELAERFRVVFMDGEFSLEPRDPSASDQKTIPVLTWVNGAALGESPIVPTIARAEDAVAAMMSGLKAIPMGSVMFARGPMAVEEETNRETGETQARTFLRAAIISEAA